jgi:hypothetical protein
MRRGWKVIVLFLGIAAAACGGGGDSRSASGEGEHMPPDAGSTGPACGHQACGLPGDQPCCTGTSCIDFRDFGAQQCAQACKTSADCDTGCCQADGAGDFVCSPKEFCGDGGIYPEALCRDADTCDIANNQVTCVGAVESCLKPLSQSQLSAWFAAVNACYAASGSSCVPLFGCLRNLSFCAF